jgi:hypothetical protein
MEVDQVKLRVDQLDTHIDRARIDWLPKKIREKNCAATLGTWPNNVSTLSELLRKKS